MVACKVLGATAEILDYAHEHIDVNLENRRRITRLLLDRAPDIAATFTGDSPLRT